MNLLDVPFRGFTGDADMVAFWRMTEVVTNPVIDHSPYAAVGANPKTLTRTELDASAILNVKSLFDPDTRTTSGGAFLFTGLDWFTSSAFFTNQEHLAFSGASASFGAALWYSLGTTATQCIVEFSGTPGGTGGNGVGFSLWWLGLQNKFMFRWNAFNLGGVSTVRIATSPEMPTKGMFAFDAKYTGVTPGFVATSRNLELNWYHNGLNKGDTDVVVSFGAPIASAVSARWTLGASTHAGTSYFSPLFPVTNGTLCELAVWRKPIGDAKALALYGSSKVSYDQQSLIETNSQVVRCRVFVEDSAGVMQNLSQFDSQDWVQRVDISDAVDEDASKATIVLRRRRGRYAELSPLNAEPDYAGLLALRRKVRIERCMVPQLWTIQGWEWKTRFEGFIDKWQMAQDEVKLLCSDKSAALSDAFIMDTRSYNFNPNVTAENHQQEILNDFEPTIDNQDREEIIIGYKGEFPDIPPQLYTKSGTAASRLYRSSGNILRFNDVSSGPVFNAVKSVGEIIGFDTRYVLHEPWQQHRLTNFSPRRSFQIQHEMIIRVDSKHAKIDFSEQHGLSLRSPVRIAGTQVSLDFSGTVSSVVNYYAVVVEGTTASIPAGAATSGGTVTFSYNLALKAEQILDITEIESDISNIRNHARVKFQRNVTTTTLTVIEIERTAFGLTIAVDGDMSSVDPDGNGIPFTLVDPNDALGLAGDYTGDIQGITVIQTELGGGADDVFSTSLPFVSSEFIAFQEVVSTSTPSMNAFGLLPMAVYEGSTLAISSASEAGRLARALVSDLAFPTADVSITTNILPLEIGDLVNLPIDPKGRWTTATTAAITSLRETYASGECKATYGLRFQAPTMGKKWAAAVAVNQGQPGMPNNNRSTDATDLIDEGIVASGSVFGSTKAGQFDLNVNRRYRAAAGLRQDQTQIWLSDVADFIPTYSNRVTSFRGGVGTITVDGDGTPLVPGRQYHLRYSDRDIFGNLSAPTGMGRASPSTVVSFVPRFADQTAGVGAVASVSATTLAWGTLFTPIFADLDDGSDAAGISYDRFSNYSTSSRLFQAPCDGFYAALHEGSWGGDNANNFVFGRVGRFNGSMVTLGYSDIKSSASYSSKGVVRFLFSEVMYCNSGDFLRVEAATGPGGAGGLLRGSTFSATFCKVGFALMNQK